MQQKIRQLIDAQKPVLVTDIDGVLSRYYEDLVAESERRWGAVHGINEDHTKVWGVSYDEGLRRLAELRADGFYDRIGHDKESVTALRQLSDTYTIATLTSRPVALERSTNEWLAAHYGNTISHTIHAGIFDTPGASYEQQLRTTKAAFVRHLVAQGVNVAWFIDDEPKHVTGVAGLGIRTIHMRKDWHTNTVIDALPTGIERLSTWRQIYAHIAASQPVGRIAGASIY